MNRGKTMSIMKWVRNIRCSVLALHLQRFTMSHRAILILFTINTSMPALCGFEYWNNCYRVNANDESNINNLAATGGGIFEIPDYIMEYDSYEDEYIKTHVDIISLDNGRGYWSEPVYAYNPNASVVVKMPDTVEVLNGYVFQGLTSVKEVVLPKNLKFIGTCAFADCGGIQSIIIPDNVETIEDWAFGGCGALEAIKLPSKLRSIAYGLFYQCNRLRQVEIPIGVTEIGNAAFKNCSSMDTITIPDSVTNIHKQAFYGCNALSKVTILGNGVSIGDEAFYDCTNLQTVVIKGKNIRLGAGAFSQCHALKTIDMSCFNEIGGAAFFACPSIEDISLSADVTISPFAFMGCNGVKNIKIVAQDAYSSGFTNMFFSTKETFDVACDIVGGDIRPVKMDTGFIPNIHSLSNVTDFIVAEGATEGSDRLYLPPNAKRCTIPASMTNLTERLIRGGVKYTVDKNNQCYCSDDYGSLFTKDRKKLLAYGNPDRMWHIVGFNGWFGSSVPPEEIADGAFQNCDNVRWMTFPQGVTKIGAKAFKGCTGLESIRFEGPRITKAPFGPLLLGAGKTNVISLINGGPVKSIGESAFADCLNLRCELYFPDTLSTIGDMAFANCPKLSFARFYGAAPTVKDIYPERGVFHNSGAYGVSCEYRFDYTNKWAKAMQTYTIVDGHVVTNDNIIGYWQEAHCYPDHIESKPDEIIVYDGAYRLTLDANDGACAVSTLIVESGEKIDDMPDAMRDGYSFIGWFDAFDGGTKVSTNTVIECDMTLYAHWSENPPPIPTYTETTPVPVQHDWLAKYSGILTAAGNDYEAAAMRPTGKRDGKGNALCVWHDYVAGTDPTNLNSRFKAKVDLANGTPVVSWEPDLNDDGTKSERFYKVFGKKTLAANENWTRIADETAQKDYNFFKVTVNMEETPDTEEELKFGNGTGDETGESGESDGPGSLSAILTIEDDVLKRVDLNGSTSLAIPNGVKRIAPSALSFCDKLKSVTIPNTVTNIGDMAFMGCTKLENLIVPDGVEYIGSSAFAQCEALGTVSIPGSVKNIGGWSGQTFSGCKGLTNVVFRGEFDGLAFGDNAFYFCTSLKTVALPEGTRSLDRSVFMGCWALTDVSIPSTLTDGVNYMTFANCVALTNIVVSQNNDSYSSLRGVLFDKLGENIVYAPHGIRNLIIPATVTSFDVCAFSDHYDEPGDTVRMNFFVEAGNTRFASVEGLLTDKSGNTLLAVPSGRTVVYVPGSIQAIGDNAFMFCSSLVGVSIPANVSHIGWYAFEFCSSLKRVEIAGALDDYDISVYEYGVPNDLVTHVTSNWTGPIDTWCDRSIVVEH